MLCLNCRKPATRVFDLLGSNGWQQHESCDRCFTWLTERGAHIRRIPILAERAHLRNLRPRIFAA